jgi:hypothetical protein
MQMLSGLAQRATLALVIVVGLSACAMDDTPSAASTSNPAADTTVQSTEPETVEIEVTTVPEATTTTTTVAAQEPDIRCITVLKCQFSYLVGVDYSLLKLEFTDFSVANLAGAKFMGSNVNQAQFIRANLTDVDFTGANLTGANLNGALVSGANFTKANLTNTVICGLDLESVVGISAEQLGVVKVFRAKGNRYCQ